MGKDRSSRTDAVLDFIKDYKYAHNGNSPTVREIMAGTDISSTSVATYYLKKLEQTGVIAVHGVRQIEVAGFGWVNLSELKLVPVAQPD